DAPPVGSKQLGRRDSPALPTSRSSGSGTAGLALRWLCRRRFVPTALSGPARSWLTFGPSVAETKSVSIWADDLRAGALPSICVKSGRPSDSRLTFQFVTYGWPAWFFLGPLLARLVGRKARGPLPLTRRWRLIFIAFRAVAITFALLAFVAYWSPVMVPSTWLPWTLGGGLAALALYVSTHTLYAGLRPKGGV